MNAKNNIVLKSSRFEKAKKRLHDFSQEEGVEIYIPFVEEDYELIPRGIWKKSVNGEDLNRITQQISSILINMNNTSISLKKEFFTLYNALDALDKDYINSINNIISSLKKTDDDLKKVDDDLKKASDETKEEVQVLSYSIEKLLEDVSKIKEQQKEFEKKLNKLAEIYNENLDKDTLHKKIKNAYIVSIIAICMPILFILIYKLGIIL